MKNKKLLLQRLFISFSAACVIAVAIAEDATNTAKYPAYPLQKMTVHLEDTAALQRGAKMFMNYCSGCHSLKYLRYDRMARDMDITTLEGKVDEPSLRAVMFDPRTKISDPIVSAMSPEDARIWFGLPAPDLSLVARSRSVNWLYTYLKSFYKEEHRGNWGVNNLVFENVAMPNVLEPLQGVQTPVIHEGRDGPSVYLAKLSPGSLSPADFDQVVRDLVTFLAYVAEPTQGQRSRLGGWVLAFLCIFAVSAYFLKREYWKDVK